MAIITIFFIILCVSILSSQSKDEEQETTQINETRSPDMKKSSFITIFIVVALIAVAVFAGGMAFSAQNKAIDLEEQVNESFSGIKVQEERRASLIINLADSVKAFSKHEKETFVELAKARASKSGGTIENASVTIQSVAEAYPELKTDSTYLKFMKEITVTENKISDYRDNYNLQVKAYNKHIRKFPNSALLNIMGYDKLDVDYLDFDTTAEAPTNLFDDDKSNDTPTDSSNQVDSTTQSETSSTDKAE